MSWQSEPERGYQSTRLGVPLPEQRARVLQDIALNLEPHLPIDHSAEILEIGFGHGDVLGFLKRKGYRNYVGIDVDAELVGLGAVQHPVELVDSASAYLAGRKTTYDAIVMRNVIAHLGRDEAVELAINARQALKPSGVFLVQTFNAALPSGPYTLAKDMTQSVAYTEQSLHQLLALGGFESISVAPGRLAVHGLSGRLYVLARWMYVQTLRIRFILDRGAGENPTIYSKSLLAVGTRS